MSKTKRGVEQVAQAILDESGHISPSALGVAPAGFEWDDSKVRARAWIMFCAHYEVIGVFENANRAPVGAPPKFEAASFHTYDLRD